MRLELRSSCTPNSYMFSTTQMWQFLTPVQGQPCFLPRSPSLLGNLFLLWHLNSFSLMNLESGRTFNFPTGFHLVLINYLSHLSETPLWFALISDFQNPCNLLLSEAYSRFIGERECPLLHLLLSQFINFTLVSCSAFLKTVVSFSIFLTLDYFVNLSLPSACPLSPGIFIAREY